MDSTTSSIIRVDLSSSSTAATISIETGNYPSAFKGMVITGSGNDILTLSGGVFADANIDTGAGSDTITISGVTLEDGLINGDDGVDYITMDSGSITGRINGGAGDDVITINGGTIIGRITPDVGDDTVLIYGGTITGTIHGGLGDDAFLIYGGTINGDFTTGIDDDVILLDSGTITGDIGMKAGADKFVWTGGTWTGSFNGGGGDDTVSIQAQGYDGQQVLDGGTGTDTLNLSSITATSAGADIVNWEIVKLRSAELTINDGLWTVGDGSSATGVFLVDSTLNAADGLDLQAGLSIDVDSKFQGEGGGSGTYSFAYGLVNNGNLSTMDNAVGDTIKVAGNYYGYGTVSLDVDFSTSTSDILTVDGIITAIGVPSVNGSTTPGSAIYINGLKSSSNDSKEQITLVSATTDTDRADESFTLASYNQYQGNTRMGRFSNSPYIWQLEASDNSWVLNYAYEIPKDDDIVDPEDRKDDEKPAIVSEIPGEVGLYPYAYEVAMAKLDTLHRRMGELRHATGSAADPFFGFNEKQTNVWFKGNYGEFNFKPDDNFDLDANFHIYKMGFDRKAETWNNLTAFVGFYGSYINGSYETDREEDEFVTLYDISTDVDGWSGGFYATMMSPNGTYGDLVLDYMSLHANITGADDITIKGTILSASLELGHSFVVMPRLVIEPQIQAKVAQMDWKDVFDGYNMVEFPKHVYLSGRVGVRAEYTIDGNAGQVLKPWIYAGVEREFTDCPTIENATSFESYSYDTVANFQAGLTVKIAQMWHLYGDVGYSGDFDEYDSLRMDLGLRFSF